MGIGNTAPQSTLSVGNASVSNSNGTISVAKNNGSGGNRQFQMGYDSNFNMVFGDAGGNNIIAWVSQFTIAYNAPASSLVINGSGQVGIGTGNPAFGLDVFTGGVRVIATQSTGNLMHNTGPLSDNAYVLGWSGYRWISLTAVNGTIQTSDSSVKNASPLPYGLAALQQEPFDTVHAAFFEDAPDALQVYKDENTWMALRMVFLENPVAKHEVMVEVRDGVTVRELLEEREQGRRCDRWC